MSLNLTTKDIAIKKKKKEKKPLPHQKERNLEGRRELE